ncbi:MAG: hypothetical protein J5891_08545 [Spirochaetales bacterium]|nr:hypothetical protein [Spirochaetales bacterium]
MKHLFRAFSLLFLVVLLASSCVSTDRTLLIVPEEGMDTEFRASGTIGARSEDGLQMIAGADYFDGSNANFLVSLASVNSSSVPFSEEDIAIYGGNAQTCKWTLIDRWDSNLYLKSEKAKADAAIFATGVIGTLAVINAILNPDDVDFYIDYDYPIYYPHHGYYRYSYGGLYISGGGPVGAAFTALSTIETTIALSQMSDMYQAELERTLLQDTIITAEHPASGMVAFRGLPEYPDYKLVYNNGKEDMEFTFARSDRDEILHPWRDKSSTQVAFNYSYTFGTRRNSITLDLLSPKYLGGFFGFSFYPPIPDRALQSTVGFSFGLNWKTAAHCWLQAGLELYDIPDSEDVGLLALMGANLCFYHISIYGGAVYDVNGHSWYGEAGLGLVF